MVNEKDVENTHRSLWKSFYPQVDAKITSPYGTDGVLEYGDLKVLMEFKFGLDFDDKNKSLENKVIVISQGIAYIHKMEKNGEAIPNFFYAASEKNCFYINVNYLQKYLGEEDVDWSIAPSSFFEKNKSLVKKLMEDDNIHIHSFVYESKDFPKLIEKLRGEFVKGVFKTRITEKNLQIVFEEFNEKFLKESELDVQSRVNLFIQTLISPDDHFVHPKKKTELITKNFDKIKIKNGNEYKNFFEKYTDVYTIKEKEKFTEMLDVLIEDEKRRFQGEFFTPRIFVDKAHEYLDEVFGEGWRTDDKYVVWDCACGTMNLTRDYKFRNLFCSTLEESDIITCKEMGYNPEAMKFQFDFLNDDDDKLPAVLRQYLEDPTKEFIFLINPPYGTGGEFSREEGKQKGGIAINKMNELMKKEEWGACSQQLFSQFLYRIYLFSKKVKTHVAIFSKSIYKTGSTYKKFREKFYNKFSFKNGFLFNASYFNGTSDAWAIDFSIWKGEEKPFEIINDVIDINKISLVHIGKKIFIDYDDQILAKDWVRFKTINKTIIEYPVLTSFNILKEKSTGNFYENGIGYFYSDSNSIRANIQGVSIFSGLFSNGHGLTITKENILECSSLFAARRSIKANWLNEKDEYIAPNESHEKWEEFKNDSLVYSLFESASSQSSLRQVSFHGKLWDIPNHFFWMDKEVVKELANQNGFDELYADVKTDKNRFVYEILSSGIRQQLSNESLNVLENAERLFIQSFPRRKEFAENNPDLHLHAWDAGYAQLKDFWKKEYPEEFAAFRESYKILEEKMRARTYEVGFLV